MANFSSLPPELRMSIFELLLDPAANRVGHRYNFNISPLLINKLIGDEAKTVLHNMCNMVVVQFNIPNMIFRMQGFQVPFLSIDHAQVALFLQGTETRLHFQLARRAHAAHAPFQGLLLARDMPSLCYALQMEFYRWTMPLMNWTTNQQPNGEVIVTRPPNALVNYTISLNFLRGMGPSDERATRAALGNLIYPGSNVIILGPHQPPPSPLNLVTRMGPTTFTLSAAAWHMLAMVKKVYAQMRGYYLTDQLHPLQSVFQSVQRDWQQGFLDIALEQHPNISLPVAAARAILLDCSCMMFLQYFKRGRTDDATELLKETMEVQERDLRDEIPRQTSMCLEQSLLNHHLEVYRCTLLHDLPNLPWGVVIPPLQQMLGDLANAVHSFHRMSTLKPQRRDIAAELRFLQMVQRNEHDLRDLWVNRQWPVIGFMGFYKIGDYGDVPCTEKAHNVVPPDDLDGWA